MTAAGTAPTRHHQAAIAGIAGQTPHFAGGVRQYGVVAELVGVLVVPEEVEGVFSGGGGGTGQKALLLGGGGGGSTHGAARSEGGGEEQLGGLVGEHVDGLLAGLARVGFWRVQDTDSTTRCAGKFRTEI